MLRKSAHIRRRVARKQGSGRFPAGPTGNFIAGSKRERYRATSAIATQLDSVRCVLFIDRHGDCDLPMRRQLKHRVRLSAPVHRARTRRVVDQLHFR
jgi:hypothetical protein